MFSNYNGMKVDINNRKKSGKLTNTWILKNTLLGFPGGAVVQSLPANAEDTGLSPGLGRSHMPRSN